VTGLSALPITADTAADLARFSNQANIGSVDRSRRAGQFGHHRFGDPQLGRRVARLDQGLAFANSGTIANNALSAAVYLSTLPTPAAPPPTTAPSPTAARSPAG
jgi:hypothetical protein